jgi:hypothetical protein
VEILRQSLIRGLNQFSSYNAALELCNMVILKWLNYKPSVWAESNGRTSWSNPPILQGLQKVTFNVLKWGKKIFFCNCRIADMVFYSRNHISSFEISLRTTPSHSSLILFIDMLETTLGTSWGLFAPLMEEL